MQSGLVKNNNMDMVTLSHPLGTPFSAHAATGLHKAGQLSQVATGFCFKRNSSLRALLAILPSRLSTNISKQLARRAWIEDPQIIVREFPWSEVLRMLIVKSSVNKLFGISYQKLTDAVFINFDRQVAVKIIPHSDVKAVYTYEDCALETFIAAKKRGIKCIYDLPIMYYKESTRLECEEALRFPQFKSALYAAQDSSDKLQRKEKELSLADHVVVASELTKNSLLKYGYSENRISVIPYGAPPSCNLSNDRSLTEKFRVIFVGRVGPRKGVHYLLDAWKKAKLKDAELCLVGINEFSHDYLKDSPTNVKIVGSVPHSELSNYYAKSDLLVLPSLVEGFGMVLLEAMACGLPVLASENTAAPDIVDNGIDGFIVPIRDPESLQEKLVWAFENRLELKEMGRQARKKAEQLSWQRYETDISRTVRKILTQQ